VVGQGVAVADAGGVQQQGVQDVLVHIGAFLIYMYTQMYECTVRIDSMNAFMIFNVRGLDHRGALGGT
jgi:hypothetical protein